MKLLLASLCLASLMISLNSVAEPQASAKMTAGLITMTDEKVETAQKSIPTATNYCEMGVGKINVGAFDSLKAFDTQKISQIRMKFLAQISKTLKEKGYEPSLSTKAWSQLSLQLQITDKSDLTGDLWKYQSTTNPQVNFLPQSGEHSVYIESRGHGRYISFDFTNLNIDEYLETKVPTMLATLPNCQEFVATVQKNLVTLRKALASKRYESFRNHSGDLYLEVGGSSISYLVNKEKGELIGNVGINSDGKFELKVPSYPDNLLNTLKAKYTVCLEETKCLTLDSEMAQQYQAFSEIVLPAIEAAIDQQPAVSLYTLPGVNFALGKSFYRNGLDINLDVASVKNTEEAIVYLKNYLLHIR